jgi:hypothetical protein
MNEAIVIFERACQGDGTLAADLRADAEYHKLPLRVVAPATSLYPEAVAILDWRPARAALPVHSCPLAIWRAGQELTALCGQWFSEDEIRAYAARIVNTAG